MYTLDTESSHDSFEIQRVTYDTEGYYEITFCLIWFFKSQSTIFQLCRDGLPGLNQY